MNTSKYIKSLLPCLVALLALVGCSSERYQEPVVSFQVVKAEVPSAFTAGEGFIDVTEEGFSIASEDPSWLTAELESPRRVKVKLAKNDNPESRTASIILTKGETVQRIAVTQVGVVNQATMTDQTFARRGGTYEVSLEQMDSQPQVEMVADWITYTIEAGKLIFTIAPLEGDERSASVRVRAGLFDRTITITQIYGAPTYEELLGDYTLDFIVEYNTPALQLDVALVVGEQGKSYRLSGLHNLVITYDERTGKMRLAPQAIAGGDPADFAYAWLSGYDGQWSLYSDAKYYFEATWNRDEANPKFAFAAPNKVPIDNVEHTIRGLAFYNLGTGAAKGWVRRGAVAAITNFSLTKK